MHIRIPVHPAGAPRLALIGLMAVGTSLGTGAGLAAPVRAAAKAPAAGAAIRTGLENLEKQVQEFTLPNGLRFILVERHQAPVFSYQTVVNSGSANENIGTTGIAHMMEHMAFKGTALVGSKDFAAEQQALAAEEQAWQAFLDERRAMKRDSSRLEALRRAFKDSQAHSFEFVKSDEFSRVLEAAGAQNMNAYTADDVTAYFYSLPSNRLELWGVMEGGRMTEPVFREFYKERDVVLEERRMRYESSPFGRLFLEFISAAFTAHPYGTGGIGTRSDLTTFSRSQGEDYFRRNYVAKNMVVGVVGDVTRADLQQVASKYFAGISAAPAPPPVDVVEPEQLAERRIILEDPAQPVVIVGWHIPSALDASYAAYKALADLLGGGEWARLNKVLVKEKKIAVQVEMFTGFPGARYPNLMGMVLVPATGQDPEVVEREAYAVLDSVLTTRPLTSEELAGYKVRVRAQKIGAVESNQQLADELAQAQTLYGDWRQFFREQERVQTLAPGALMNALRTSVVRKNRTVAMIVNPKSASAEGGR